LNSVSGTCASTHILNDADSTGSRSLHEVIDFRHIGAGGGL
jgi:hypothetical protein